MSPSNASAPAGASTGPRIDFDPRLPAGLELRWLCSADAHWFHDTLGDLLRDVVDADASVGFLAPVEVDRAQAYWVGLQPQLTDDHALWVACIDGRALGSVQLRGGIGPDAHHRADVSHRMVHTAWRSRGIASALIDTLEKHAMATGRILLVADLEEGSAAERLFLQRGWRKSGAVPDYARSPRGDLRAFARLYQTLAPA